MLAVFTSLTQVFLRFLWRHFSDVCTETIASCNIRRCNRQQTPTNASFLVVKGGNGILLSAGLLPWWNVVYAVNNENENMPPNILGLGHEDWRFSGNLITFNPLQKLILLLHLW